MNKISVAESFSIVLTSYALDRGREFPFVTLPDYEMRAAKARALAQASSLIWIPLVDQKDQLEWENYAREVAPEWVRDSMDVSGMQDLPTLSFPDGIHDGLGNLVTQPFPTENDWLKGKYSVLW